MRIMRGSMLEVLGQQYIMTARAKGLPEKKVISKHALRMAINPLISILGMSLPGLLSGSAIISIVMNLPTAGLLLFESLADPGHVPGRHADPDVQPAAADRQPAGGHRPGLCRPEDPL
jgi:ABC-type microcin C transport system permease subunit YejB